MKEKGDQITGTQRSPEAAGSGLDLRIEELVLHGFHLGNRYAIAAAVERELGRLLGGEGMPPGLLGVGEPAGRQGRDFFCVDAGSFEVPHDVTPDAVGTKVARAIHRSLSGLGGTSRASGVSSG